MKIPEKQGNGIVWLLTICLALQKANVSQYMLNYCGVHYLMQNIKLVHMMQSLERGPLNLTWSKETRYSLKHNVLYSKDTIHREWVWWDWKISFNNLLWRLIIWKNSKKLISHAKHYFKTSIYIHVAPLS